MARSRKTIADFRTVYKHHFTFIHFNSNRNSFNELDHCPKAAENRRYDSSIYQERFNGIRNHGDDDSQNQGNISIHPEIDEGKPEIFATAFA